MKQHEAVIIALENLGGIATLGDLNLETMKIKECEWKTKTPFASIRRIVQMNEEIYKIKPGLYSLKKYQKKNEANGILVETTKNKNSEAVKSFNHSYYQGMLTIIGNLKKFKTYLPNQDKNKKFIEKSLDELRTIKEIPHFTYQKLIQRSSTIDVIWFSSRLMDENLLMPTSFFEVEHSTDIQNSLLKFNDLQDFAARMIIVADETRKREFETKIKSSAFNEIRNKIEFLEYEALTKMYEYTLEEQVFKTKL
ncbi:MAG: hypothetical protein KBF99_13530 [Leptospiraceae bacterium]|nr:hypothetical protein [Leptospiraceae bacterium]MBK7053979.1 hypothetical protein [Leptospiraceae bacterium]MBK9499898.1 hypothetical protein [Leptospiraceae bacterium]MBL0263492.1 hypothetical protein [Leptospiraceae bacterium]MBP9164198.1 hypothetical protein [Leptospiraceae bacterium]